MEGTTITSRVFSNASWGIQFPLELFLTIALLMHFQSQVIIQRHFSMGERPLTFEELIEMTTRNPRRSVPMAAGELAFTEQGEFNSLSKFNG